MKIGMLWFDNDPKTDLKTKIVEAAVYYQKKYGARPDLCYVHPSMFKENESNNPEIEVRSNRLILPHHLWLGVQESIEPVAV